jgi:hypothetical protein
MGVWQFFRHKKSVILNDERSEEVKNLYAHIEKNGRNFQEAPQ